MSSKNVPTAATTCKNYEWKKQKPKNYVLKNVWEKYFCRKDIATSVI